MYRPLVVTASLIVACSAVASADVRIEEKTQMKFGGAMGRFVNLFAGRAAREGVVSTVAVKGDRKATRTDNTGQIIDLREEKVYDVDYKDKSYRVKTFAEIRQQMEEARKKAAEAARESGGASSAPEQAQDGEPQVDIDFRLEESGQRRTINGFDAREVVMTVAVREKGKTLEESGGLVLTTNMWMTPSIPGSNEVANFDLRYAQQLGIMAMFDAQQMAAMTAMYPMMQQAIERFEAENVKMDGTAVLTTMTVEAVVSAEQLEQQEQQQSSAQAPPTSLGGLGGALGGRLGRRILGGGNQNNDAAPSAPGRSTVMTSTHEVVKVTPNVADADVAIPAGFKLKS